MTPTSTARRLMVIVDEDAVFNHRPVYTEILRRAHDAGLAGACVFRGIEGFGSTRRVHTNRILSLTANLPAMVIIIDTEAKIAGFLAQLEELEVRGVVALDAVEIVRPGHVPDAAR
jgi:PII-like signaling protein